jgi:ribokinase
MYMNTGNLKADHGLPILVVGSLNMDLVVNSSKLPQYGETIFGENFATFPGGKGANQAVAAAKLGARVTMVGCVGQDAFASELLDGLRKVDIDTSHIRKVENSTGVALITVAQGGANTIVVVAGANQECNQHDVDGALKEYKKPGIILLQNEVPKETVEYAIGRAKEAGWQIIYNPAPARKIDDKFLAMVDILTPNETELGILTDMPVTSKEDAILAGAKLLRMGVKKIVVTMGAEGSILITDGKIDVISAISVQAVDSTAAGDCYNGAMAVGIAEGKTLGESLTFAKVAAGLSVTKRGAQTALPTLVEVNEYIEKAGRA